MSGRKKLSVVLRASAIGASLCVAAAACGSSKTTNNSANTSAAPTTTGSTATTAASGGSSGAPSLTQLETTTVSQPKPSGSVTPGSHKIAVISVGQSTPGASDTAKFVQEAIQAIGWSAPPTFDGKFSPTTQSGLIESAVNSGAQGLVLVSMTPSTVASALQFAESKKIPIVCILCGPPSTYSQFPGMVGVESSPENAGAAQAAWVAADSGGSGNVWVYEDDEFQSTVAQTTAAIADLKKDCPGCQVHTAQTKAGDEQVPGIPVLAGVLSANPKGSINYIIAPYDNAAAQFATLAAQEGRTEIKFVGYAALPVFYDQIKSGTPVGAQATVSIPLPYMAWSAIDEMARLFAGQPTWDANSLNVAIVDRKDVSSFGNQPYVNPNFDYKSFFLGLWGKG